MIEFYSERAVLHFIVSLNLGDVDLYYYSEDSYLEHPKLLQVLLVSVIKL